MKQTSETVVFFGSGPVAAASLELLARDFLVEAVITKPKPAHHRGEFPVIDMANHLGLKLFTVASKAELSALIATKPFTSKLGVLIDFGIIVAQDTIDYFEKGIVNSHFSLLPEWRGADPITFSILSGQKMTGVSLMLLVEAMDEGPLLAQAAYDISPTATASSLTSGLIELSSQLLNKIIPLYLLDETDTKDQASVTLAPDATPTYSRKLTKEDGRIDWNKPATQLDREVRGFEQWPKSFTRLGDIDVVITKAHAIEGNAKPSEVIVEGLLLSIGCGEGLLVIDELKPSGKQAMNSSAFLAGYRNRLES